MHRLVTSTPDSQVLGVAVVALIAALDPTEAKPIFAKHGINQATVTVDQWYPLQTLLDIYGDIATQEFNVTEDYVSIGMKITEAAPFPPDLKTIEDALQSLGPTYAAAHRHYNERGWFAEMVGEREAVVTADNPYPDDLCYGLLWGLVRRFVPKGHGFQIVPQPVDQTDAPITFYVTW